MKQQLHRMFVTAVPARPSNSSFASLVAERLARSNGSPQPPFAGLICPPRRPVAPRETEVVLAPGERERLAAAIRDQVIAALKQDLKQLR